MMRNYVRLWRLSPAIALVLVPSLGAQEAIAVSGGPFELTETDGTHTLAVTVTNTTERPADLMLVPVAADEGCTITVEPDEVEAHRSQEVVFTLPTTCELGEKSTDLRLTIMLGAGRDDLVFPIAAETPTDTPSDLKPLLGYAWAAGAVAIGLSILYLFWKKGVLGRAPVPPAEDSGPRGLWRRLPGLAADWSFSDSWSSNVGLAAAIFTGVLGASDVLTDALGEGNEEQVTLAVVSAALSAGLIGAATLLLAVFRHTGSRDATVRSQNTVIGVLAATGLVLTATVGQVSVMAGVIIESDLIHFAIVDALAGLAVGLIIAYAVQTVPLTLTDGLRAPSKSDPPPEVRAVVRVVAAVEKASAEAQGAPAGTDDYPYVGGLLLTSPGDEPQPRRRSAMP